ncbi:MAG: glycosyltransferase [Saprospiraceae bacterium]|nr:glycosyltransferase [Saprospiraceae bacterium]
MVKQYIYNYDNFYYFLEPNIGLSYARNRGILESKSDWVLFIDDDAIAFPDLIDRALHLIERGNYECIGGKYFGYFLGEKPKWLPNDFESYKGDEVELMDCEYSKPIGCIVLYKKNKILEVGVF